MSDDLRKRIRRDMKTELRIRRLDATDIAAEIHALEDLRDEMLAALEPFAEVAERDIGQDETDEDPFRPIQHNAAPRLTVGHLRAALAVVSKARGA